MEPGKSNNPDAETDFPAPRPTLPGSDGAGVPFEWLIKAGLIDSRPYR